MAEGSSFFIVPNQFFQSRTNLKILVAYAGTNPGHLGFRYFALSTTPRQQMLKPITINISILHNFLSLEQT